MTSKSAYEIMNYSTEWDTRDRTAWDCDWVITRITDYADLRESEVLYENTLDARGFMVEAMK